MIKTVTLTGSEVKVTDLGGQNAAVKNLGSGSIYVSTKPNITAGADNVIEIPAGAGEVVLDTNGTVYIVGTGKVQCTGTPYAVPNFKLPSTSSGGGGGTSDVTKEYVDAQDTTNLNLAKAYTDNAKSEIQTTIDTVNDTLNTHIADQVKHITAEERAKWDAKADTDTATTTADGLMSAADKKKLDGTKEYVDAQDATNLSIAKSYTDNAKAETEKTIGIIDDILNIHIANQEKHITTEERTAWNSKAELTDIPTELPANGGNADTATALTTSAGAAALPVYFSDGKPIACSNVVKHTTGTLSTGDNTISYATGYKYALILLYCYEPLGSTSNLTIQPVILTWAGGLSSTTSYDVRTISVNMTFTVSNGDLIINVSGASHYRYWVMWSN